ncbi:peptidase M29 [Acuticoccus mangrovi]|uniref:Peptidase M29 n=1 Tax=Acuticoccus mangrovi TaxID=2796142 RepID=A0A934IRZ7_9HYPH|nr:peptidase M29 [Acuticoccus mangrovi]MBJ3777590.1 peptidase M29 [Acuticoccus mangrovi]
MFADRIEGKWIDAFAELFEAARIRPDERVAILAETQSRALNVHLAELALARLGVAAFTLTVPTPRSGPMIVRSTGASRALDGFDAVVETLQRVDVVVDLTIEGLMHARQTGAILGAGTRIQVISNEHPEVLERMRPDPALKEAVREAARAARGASEMRVTSPAGSDLTVDMRGAQTVGVWGWTDKPGTLAHWPGGIVVSFPRAGTISGRLVLSPGDMNLTYKRYVEAPVHLTLADDRVRAVEGEGVDARLMRDTLAAWNDPEAYAVSHVGWGLNPAARWDALTMMDKAETNGTELRAVAGNFLFSTGANEFAGRFTEGHFDLPMMGCTISLDGVDVVREGRLV